MDCENSLSSDCEELEIITDFVAVDEENKSTLTAWVHEINEKRETLGEFHTCKGIKKRS